MEGANEIKDEVYKRFGFTVNVGISSRKVLAKMASDFEKPNKVHTLFPEEVPVKMWPLPIGELFMAGRSSVETMKKLEIYTIGDLANTDPAIHGKGSYVTAANTELMMEEQKKEVEQDLEQAILKGRRFGISDEDIKTLFELILEG